MAKSTFKRDWILVKEIGQEDDGSMEVAYFIDGSFTCEICVRHALFARTTIYDCFDKPIMRVARMQSVENMWRWRVGEDRCYGHGKYCDVFIRILKKSNVVERNGKLYLKKAYRKTHC
jgi:hypothetical protein